MATKCFLLLPVDKQQRSLRRYSNADNGKPCQRSGYSYHNATTVVGVFEGPDKKFPSASRDISEFGALYPVTDKRWPRKCEHCDYVFTEKDEEQIFHEAIWKRADTSEETTLGAAPPGAMWDAYWMSFKGPDGRCMVVKLPNGHHWTIDGPASNCNRRGEPHQCWIRQGEPPDLTISKEGNTCAVGAGSIGSGDYHGFLREGVLT